MLNSDLKKTSLAKLKASVADYEEIRESVQQNSESLFHLRKSSSEEIIEDVESYINSLANTPKEFDRSFSAYKAEFKEFQLILDALAKQADSVDTTCGTTATAGVLAGVGTAAFAPTAAMAVATTFGTASTGTAIASLTGAAATNSALAWLGGGALTAGGGGMIAGEALLALAGPVGWAIGGTALVGSGLFARHKNKKVAEEAHQKTKKVITQTTQLRAVNVEVKKLIGLTEHHVKGILDTLVSLQDAPKNYNLLTPEQKNLLISMKNNIESLSKLLNLKVS